MNLNCTINFLVTCSHFLMWLSLVTFFFSLIKEHHFEERQLSGIQSSLSRKNLSQQAPSSSRCSLMRLNHPSKNAPPIRRVSRFGEETWPAQMQKVRQSLARPPWEQAAPGNLRWQQQRPKPILEQIETSRPLSPADAQTMVAGSVVDQSIQSRGEAEGKKDGSDTYPPGYIGTPGQVARVSSTTAKEKNRQNGGGLSPTTVT